MFWSCSWGSHAWAERKVMSVFQNWSWVGPFSPTLSWLRLLNDWASKILSAASFLPCSSLTVPVLHVWLSNFSQVCSLHLFRSLKFSVLPASWKLLLLQTLCPKLMGFFSVSSSESFWQLCLEIYFFCLLGFPRFLDCCWIEGFYVCDPFSQEVHQRWP